MWVEKGVYFVSKEMELFVKGIQEWMIMADVNKNYVDIVCIMYEIQISLNLAIEIEEDICKGMDWFIVLDVQADGL